MGIFEKIYDFFVLDAEERAKKEAKRKEEETYRQWEEKRKAEQARSEQEEKRKKERARIKKEQYEIAHKKEEETMAIKRVEEERKAQEQSVVFENDDIIVRSIGSYTKNRNMDLRSQEERVWLNVTDKHTGKPKIELDRVYAKREGLTYRGWRVAGSEATCSLKIDGKEVDMPLEEKLDEAQKLLNQYSPDLEPALTEARRLIYKKPDKMGIAVIGGDEARISQQRIRKGELKVKRRQEREAEMERQRAAEEAAERVRVEKINSRVTSRL